MSEGAVPYLSGDVGAAILGNTILHPSVRSLTRVGPVVVAVVGIPLVGSVGDDSCDVGRSLLGSLVSLCAVQHILGEGSVDGLDGSLHGSIGGITVTLHGIIDSLDSLESLVARDCVGLLHECHLGITSIVGIIQLAGYGYRSIDSLDGLLQGVDGSHALLLRAAGPYAVGSRLCSIPLVQYLLRSTANLSIIVGITILDGLFALGNEVGDNTLINGSTATQINEFEVIKEHPVSLGSGADTYRDVTSLGHYDVELVLVVAGSEMPVGTGHTVGCPARAVTRHVPTVVAIGSLLTIVVDLHGSEVFLDFHHLHALLLVTGQLGIEFSIYLAILVTLESLAREFVETGRHVLDGL